MTGLPPFRLHGICGMVVLSGCGLDSSCSSLTPNRAFKRRDWPAIAHRSRSETRVKGRKCLCLGALRSPPRFAGLFQALRPTA